MEMMAAMCPVIFRGAILLLMKNTTSLVRPDICPSKPDQQVWPSVSPILARVQEEPPKTAGLKAKTGAPTHSMVTRDIACIIRSVPKCSIKTLVGCKDELIFAFQSFALGA
jgi:hypothetical protein